MDKLIEGWLSNRVGGNTQRDKGRIEKVEITVGNKEL